MLGPVAAVFPGQGTQSVGMGGWLFAAAPEVRPVLAAVSAALGADVAQLCRLGPASLLTSTEYAQPAIFCVNAAAWLYLRAQGVEPEVVAGHSLGELDALWAAGAITTEDAAALVVARGRAMASVPEAGCMAAVVGLDLDTVEALCRSTCADGRLVVALHNAEDQLVVSGPADAVKQLASAVAAEGGRSRPLATSHAFHSPLMEAAVPLFAEALAATAITDARIPVVRNVSARPTTDAAELRQGLLDQLSRPVLWKETMAQIAGLGVQVLIECGDSKVLSGFARGYADLQRMNVRELSRVAVDPYPSEARQVVGSR